MCGVRQHLLSDTCPLTTRLASGHFRLYFGFRLSVSDSLAPLRFCHNILSIQPFWQKSNTNPERFVTAIDGV